MVIRGLCPKGRFGILAGVLTAMAWIGTPGEVWADPLARIVITVIHAKRAPPFLHDGVKPLWETLRRTFGDRFAYYDLVSSTEREVAKTGRAVVPMPDSGSFAVVYRGVTEDERFLKLTIEYGELKSRVRIHDGGLFFQAGRRWQGGVLIVGVRASSVPGR